MHTANKFWFVKSQKDLAKPHSQKSTKFFKNTIIIFCLELWYSVEKYSTRCSHPAVYKGNNTFLKGIMKSSEILWGRFIFAYHSYKDGPLNLLLRFLEYILGIWEWVLIIIFGILQFKSRLQWWIFRRHIPNCRGHSNSCVLLTASQLQIVAVFFS